MEPKSVQDIEVQVQEWESTKEFYGKSDHDDVSKEWNDPRNLENPRNWSGCELKPLLFADDHGC